MLFVEYERRLVPNLGWISRSTRQAAFFWGWTFSHLITYLTEGQVRSSDPTFVTYRIDLHEHSLKIERISPSSVAPMRWCISHHISRTAQARHLNSHQCEYILLEDRLCRASESHCHMGSFQVAEPKASSAAHNWP